MSKHSDLLNKVLKATEIDLSIKGGKDQDYTIFKDASIWGRFDAVSYAIACINGKDNKVLY